MAKNKDTITPYKEAFKSFDFLYPLKDYWFKFINENYKGKKSKYALPLSPSKYRIAYSPENKLDNTIFIELTKSFFNRLRNPIGNELFHRVVTDPHGFYRL